MANYRVSLCVACLMTLSVAWAAVPLVQSTVTEENSILDHAVNMKMIPEAKKAVKKDGTIVLMQENSESATRR